MATMTNDGIAQLNAFLRAEIAAVETYEKALPRVKDPDARQEIQTARNSHEKRVEALRRRIRELGGTPTESGGAWGTFTKVLERIGSALGDRPAVAVLEEEEDHALRDYKVDLSRLDEESRRLVEQEIIPAQESTYRSVSTLRAALH